jgi:hypothetical protein
VKLQTDQSDRETEEHEHERLGTRKRDEEKTKTRTWADKADSKHSLRRRTAALRCGRVKSGKDGPPQAKFSPKNRTPNRRKINHHNHRIQPQLSSFHQPHTQCAQCGQTAATRVHTLSHSNTYPESRMPASQVLSMRLWDEAVVNAGSARGVPRFATVHSAEIDEAVSAFQLPTPTRPAPAPSACVTVPPAPSGSCTAGSAGARRTSRACAGARACCHRGRAGRHS